MVPAKLAKSKTSKKREAPPVQPKRRSERIKEDSPALRRQSPRLSSLHAGPGLTRGQKTKRLVSN